MVQRRLGRDPTLRVRDRDQRDRCRPPATDSPLSSPIGQPCTVTTVGALRCGAVTGPTVVWSCTMSKRSRSSSSLTCGDVHQFGHRLEQSRVLQLRIRADEPGPCARAGARAEEGHVVSAGDQTVDETGADTLQPAVSGGWYLVPRAASPSRSSMVGAAERCDGSVYHRSDLRCPFADSMLHLCRRRTGGPVRPNTMITRRLGVGKRAITPIGVPAHRTWSSRLWSCATEVSGSAPRGAGRDAG